MKIVDHHCARKLKHVYRFIADLIAISHNRQFENPFSEIYHEKIQLKKENPNHNNSILIYFNLVKFLDLQSKNDIV